MRRVAHKYANSFAWPSVVSKKNSKRKAGKTDRKKVQGQSKTSKNLRLGVLVLVSIAVLILISRLLDLIGGLSRPLYPENPIISLQKVNWNGKTILHLALKDEESYLLSYNPLNSSATLTKVPAETQVLVPFGYGKWPMRSVYSLGQIEKDPMGGRLFKETLSSLFGVYVSGYLILPEDKSQRKMETLVEDIRQNPLVFLGLVRSSKTDLTPLELWTLWRGIHGIRSDKIKTVDLKKANLVAAHWGNDGSILAKVDTLKLDEFFQNSFTDGNLKDEGLSIGVFNATDHPGLAEKAARIVTNFGGRVIFTSNLEEHRDTSLIMGKASYAQKLLMDIFTPNCRWVDEGIGKMFQKAPDGDNCKSQDARLTASSAEVNLVLGEDFFLRYNTK